eukprot:8727119-Lingulodinium_polyedra.AAC.1
MGLAGVVAQWVLRCPVVVWSTVVPFASACRVRCAATCAHVVHTEPGRCFRLKTQGLGAS